MSSPNDNVQFRDGLDALYKLRTKDISAAQDGSLQAIRHLASLHPVDYGIGGCYHTLIKSGIMAAGLAGGSPILSFRNPDNSRNALIRRVRFDAWSLSVGFAAGLYQFEMYQARSFTVTDTGGAASSLATPQGKLRTDMGGSISLIQHSTTATLTAGTRTLDTAPVEAINALAPTTTNTAFYPRSSNKLFDKVGSDHPMLLTQNEGFIIQATMPATGTWQWSAAIEWDEVPRVNY